MAEQVDTVVIGAGVVGLAVARALAIAGHEVLILEREDAFGTITSARNSEVIHAGIYYAKDSLKARLCVAGRRMLYEFCADRGIPHRRCGKLIVACSENELDQFAGIARRAWDNGVEDLRQISREEALALEPDLECHGALLSPSTGIVDSHGYMLALLGEAETHDAMRFHRGGHHALMLERLERFGRAGRTVTVSTVLTSTNVDDVLDLADWLRSYHATHDNVHAWHLYRFLPHGRGGRRTEAQLQIPEERYLRVCDSVQALALPFRVFRRADMYHSRTVGFFWSEKGRILTDEDANVPG